MVITIIVAFSIAQSPIYLGYNLEREVENAAERVIAHSSVDDNLLTENQFENIYADIELDKSKLTGRRNSYGTLIDEYDDGANSDLDHGSKCKYFFYFDIFKTESFHCKKKSVI